MMERKTYTAFGKTGFGEMGRHHRSTSRGPSAIAKLLMF